MVLESLLCKRSLFCSNNIHPFCSRQICTTGQEYLEVYWSRISVLDITKCQLPCFVTSNIYKEIDIVREPRVCIHNCSRQKCNIPTTLKPGKKITRTIKVVFFMFSASRVTSVILPSLKRSNHLGDPDAPAWPSHTSHFKLLP